MGRRVICLLALAAGLLAAGAGAADAATKRRATARLSAFDSCAELVNYARRNFRRTGGRVWAPFSPAPLGPPQRGAPGGEGDSPQAVSAPAPPGTDFSTTNNQEEGVDEPDFVKTDGSRIYAVIAGRLYAVDARAPKLLGSLALSGTYGHELLLRGRRLLVVSQESVPMEGPVGVARSSIAPLFAGGKTRIDEVDVSDPAAMKLAKTLTVDGDYVAARRNGGTARVVVSSSPHVLIAPATEARGTGWVPRAVLSTRGRRRTVRRASTCRAVRRPPSFSGVGMLTVLTIDLDRGLPAIDSDAIMSDAQTVYGSPKSLYVATQRWIDPTTAPDRLPQSARTALHRFDASNPDRTDYRASGEVPGYLLNQFSLSEFRGVLRVATTEDPVWANGTRAQDSQSTVTVLDQHGTRLDQVGRVSGLGRGERIYSVRFIEDVGYVVTFRQTDPLYTVDLLDPTKPRVLGELQLLGYSAYLHPIGRDLVLGVGRDASPEGRVRGAQLSLFDVSDLRAPKLLGRHSLGGSSSTDAEFDHRAFLHWPPTGLTVLPVQVYDDPQPGSESARAGPAFVGAVGLRVRRATGISELGRLVHDRNGQAVPINRSLVVGSRVFTLSAAGLLASSLATLAPERFVAFSP